MDIAGFVLGLMGAAASVTTTVWGCVQWNNLRKQEPALAEAAFVQMFSDQRDYAQMCDHSLWLWGFLLDTRGWPQTNGRFFPPSYARVGVAVPRAAAGPGATAHVASVCVSTLVSLPADQPVAICAAQGGIHAAAAAAIGFETVARRIARPVVFASLLNKEWDVYTLAPVLPASDAVPPATSQAVSVRDPVPGTSLLVWISGKRLDWTPTAEEAEALRNWSKTVVVCTTDSGADNVLAAIRRLGVHAHSSITVAFDSNEDIMDAVAIGANLALILPHVAFVMK